MKITAHNKHLPKSTHSTLVVAMALAIGPLATDAMAAVGCGNSELTEAQIVAVLKVHNDARTAAVAAVQKAKDDGKDVPADALAALTPLSWNCKLAKVAQKWADDPGSKDGSTHSTSDWRKQEYQALDSSSNASIGENIASQWGSPAADRAPDSLAMGWVEERNRFDLITNKCSQSPCGHFTLVVWRQTTEVGCGIKDRPESAVIKGEKWDGTRRALVCQYLPAGNVNSQTPLLDKH